MSLAHGAVVRWWTLVGVVGLVFAATSPAFSQDPSPVPPALDDRALLQKYVLSTLGPSGALHATLASGLEQWRRSPVDWDMNGAGYARRWASAFAESAIG